MNGCGSNKFVVFGAPLTMQLPPINNSATNTITQYQPAVLVQHTTPPFPCLQMTFISFNSLPNASQYTTLQRSQTLTNNMARPRRKQRRNRRSSPLPQIPDPLLLINDSDNSSISSVLADDYITNLLSQSDTELVDLPPLSPSPKRKTSKSRRSSSSASSASQSPSSPRKHPRSIVMEDSMEAFSTFSQRNNPQTAYACRTTPDSRHRLALHRASELMGATSSSMGTGKGRHVIMNWPTGKKLPISEAAFQRGVTRILDELIPERRERRSGGRERQREFARQIRVARMWTENDHIDDMNEINDIEERVKALSTNAKQVGSAEKVGRGNVGFNMLEKMGWSEGTGLGAERDGRMEPLIGERRMGRAGLGSM